LLMGKWWCWWGGGSAGERMTSDVTPLWGVALALACRRYAGTPRLRNWFIGSCAYAGFVHLLITFVRPNAFATTHFLHMSGGAWDPRAFAPLAYLMGAL
jgi:hypothetical protein